MTIDGQSAFGCVIKWGRGLVGRAHGRAGACERVAGKGSDRQPFGPRTVVRSGRATQRGPGRAWLLVYSRARRRL